MFSRVVSNFRKKRRRNIQIKLNSEQSSTAESNEIEREGITATNKCLSSKVDCENAMGSVFDNKPGCDKNAACH